MTPIVTTPHPNTDRRWSSTGDAAARPYARIIDGRELPSAVSAAEKISSRRCEAHFGRTDTTVSTRTIRSGHPERSHFPHRQPHHPA